MLIQHKALFRQPQSEFYSRVQSKSGQNAESGYFIPVHSVPGSYLRFPTEKEAAEYLHGIGTSWNQIAQESNYDPAFLDITSDDFAKTGERIYQEVIFEDFRGRRVLKKHDLVKAETQYFEEVNGVIRDTMPLT